MVRTRNARATHSAAAAVPLTQRVVQILKMYVNIYDEAATMCRPTSQGDMATSQGDTSLAVTSTMCRPTSHGTLCWPTSHGDTATSQGDMATSQGDTSLAVTSKGDMSTPSAQRERGAAMKEAHELSVAQGVREAPRNAEVCVCARA